MLEFFTTNIATYPPAVWCNQKGIHFVPIRLGIPFKYDLWRIDKIENDQIYPGAKIYNEFTTYEASKPVLNVFDVIVGIYKQLALRK